MRKRRPRTSPIQWEWKDELKESILYNKYIVDILKAEWDKWLTTENWRREEQYNRNLNYYENKVKELNLEWQKQIQEALTKKETS